MMLIHVRYEITPNISAFRIFVASLEMMKLKRSETLCVIDNIDLNIILKNDKRNKTNRRLLPHLIIFLYDVSIYIIC